MMDWKEREKEGIEKSKENEGDIHNRQHTEIVLVVVLRHKDDGSCVSLLG